MGRIVKILLVLGSILALSIEAAAAARTLSFQERVRAQEAIERVYYSHQIGATLPFEQAVPRDLLERKVRTYLKETAALERYWKVSVTDADLEREVARMGRTTRMPGRLRELFDALHDDPVTIRECLARPTLVARLVRHFYAFDGRFHGTARAAAEALRLRLQRGGKAGEDPQVTSDTFDLVPEGSGEAEVPAGTPGAIGTPLRPPAPRREPASEGRMNAWRAIFAKAPSRIGEVMEEGTAFTVPVLVEDSPSQMTVTVYSVPKRPLEVWWKEVEAGLEPALPASASAVPLAKPRKEAPAPTASLMSSSTAAGAVPLGHESCDPAGTWDAVNLSGVPSSRLYQTAVWTGSVMIVWGGSASDGSLYSSGGRYDPATDTWEPTSTVNAPSARSGHTAVWTGSRMIVWGGKGGYADWLNSGGRYDPVSDSWTPTSLAGAPEARVGHTAVWTGSEMVIWGGRDGSYLNTGGRYDPGSDTWAATSTTGAPSARSGHTAVWTRSRMIVWGSADDGTGGQYDPVADAWIPTSTAAAPSARSGNTAVWTGSRMIVWGGSGGSNPFYTDSQDTGGRYDPASDTWTPTSVGDAPSARYGHTADWTGSLMIIWGAATPPSGGRYDPSLNEWTPVSIVSAPTGHRPGVWTGSRMIVWGGSIPTYPYVTNTGGRYDPIADAWTSTSTVGAPSARWGHTLVWTGSRLIVWGGTIPDYPYLTDTGGVYDPVADVWRRDPTSTAGAPAGRRFHTAVWTGSRMIVWGGETPSNYDVTETGGVYDPVADTWSPTSTVSAPSAREFHTAVWTGSRMIVWGGSYRTYSCPHLAYPDTGGLYDPSTDTWSPMTTAGAPDGRTGHTALWSGSPGIGQMILWGGSYVSRWDDAYCSSEQEHIYPPGASYNPATDAWTTLTDVNAPSARRDHTAVVTPNWMLIWGGVGPGGKNYPTLPVVPIRDGGRYVLVADYDADGDGYSVCDGDCNDASPTVYPGAVELCDGLDNDCNGSIDEGSPPLPDSDGDGYSACQGDCDDANPTVYPGAVELCDGVDNNCDGTIDEGPPPLPDSDGDGYSACQGDCNDADASIHPGVPEIPDDGIDQNCNGFDEVTCYTDLDGDGYGILPTSLFDLGTCPAPGWSGASGDCDDGDPSAYPGAVEVCDGVDNNCDGAVDEGFDQDGDGWTTCAGDCNDANTSIYPGAPEICDDLDDDCNGIIEDHLDQDSDGYILCGDCDDNDPQVYYAPYEEDTLTLTGGSIASLTWDDQASIIGPETVYDLRSGAITPAAGIDFSSAACLETGWSDYSYNDSRSDPSPGDGYWYLVRSRNSCGTSSYGSGTLGERSLPACP